ncbi:MAG: hypothetical protein IT374_18110 [Polyangiaceae bacterium]|nr:hypothetical protein [Polyangiaceae bacterium]
MSGRVDVEALAFSEGLKPAIRRSVAVGQLDAATALARRLGGAVSWSTRDIDEDGRRSRVMYLGRTQAEADALRDAEAEILPGSTTARPAAHARLGALLGFPRCCVDAFAGRVERGIDVVVGLGRGLAEDYVAAHDAWTPRAVALVNPLWMRQRRSLVSFYPCRFDCDAALEVARGVLGAVARRDEALADALVATLTGSIVVAPDGARVALVDGVPAPRPGGGGEIDPRDAELARRLLAGVATAIAGRPRSLSPIRVDFASR